MWRTLRQLRLIRLIRRKAILWSTQLHCCKSFALLRQQHHCFFCTMEPDLITTECSWHSLLWFGALAKFWNMHPTRLFKLAALPDESLPHSEQLFTNVHESLLAETPSVQNLNKLPQERTPWSMCLQTWVKTDFSFFDHSIPSPHQVPD